MAGIPGPVPKRSEERQRRNESVIPINKLDVTNLIKASVDVPEAEEKWHPIARRWYDALSESAQCVYYEPSDWAIAYIIAESISRDLKPQVVGVSEETGEAVMAIIPLKGASLAGYLKAFGSLLATEGDRRRLAVEITRAAQVDMPDVDSGTANLAARRQDAIGN